MKKITIIIIAILALASCTVDVQENIPHATESEKIIASPTNQPESSELPCEILNAYYLNGGGENDYNEYPISTQINSINELSKYYESYKYAKNLNGNHGFYCSYPKKSFTDVAEKYDDEFFKDNSIIIVEILEGSGRIRHDVKTVDILGDEITLGIQRLAPSIITSDMASWLIVIEIQSSYKFKAIDIKIENKDIKSTAFEFLTPTITSGQSTVEVYDHVTYSKTYDKDTGDKIVVENNGVLIEDVAQSLVGLKLCSDLEVVNPSSEILSITIFDKAYKVVDIIDNLTMGQLLRYDVGTYYVKMKYQFVGIYNDIAKKNDYFAGEYVFKLIIDDKKYGLEKSLYEICSLDTLAIKDVRVNIKTDYELLEDVSTLADNTCVDNLLSYLRATKFQAINSKPSDIDYSREISLATSDSDNYIIMKTKEGIAIASNEKMHYINTPPWCFDIMLSAVTGQLIIPPSDILHLAKEDINKRDYSISFEKEYETSMELVAKDWGYEWLVVFKFPYDTDKYDEVKVGISTSGIILSVDADLHD